MNIADLRALPMRTLLLGRHPDITQSMLDYDYLCGFDRPSVVAIVAGGRKQERFFWGEREIIIPVVPTIDALTADQRNSITAVLNVQSARRVLSATTEALQKLPNLRVGSVFAEQTPEQHALQLAHRAREKNMLLCGPASVGMLLPGHSKLGAIGGTRHPQITAAHITSLGDTAVISTSGGMVNELIHTVTGSGLGVSFAIALGGDRFPLTTPAEAFLLAQHDPATARIVYFGELGGDDEYAIAELLAAKKVTKPVFAYIAGTVAELFETPPQFGHAKAMAKTRLETAAAKKEALAKHGVHVCQTFGELAPALKKLSSGSTQPVPARSIGVRRKSVIVSRLSGDRAGDVHLLGDDLLSTVEAHSLAGLTISMLLGERVTSQKLTDFTDYVMRLLVDHGPYVSGAMNTIVSARAGRDLVSSLSSGLLTIGPRFGGAINQAAGHWLQGVSDQLPAKDFVNSFTSRGGIISGIGHKKYRIDMPDPRVASLMQFAANKNGDRYLQFARSVEAITTAKKGNLILNVDGAIAAVLLDLLESELDYPQQKLRELVDTEFFNALFVLSRSIGFTAHYLDQRRNDEGLLRLGDDEVTYIA